MVIDVGGIIFDVGVFLFNGYLCLSKIYMNFFGIKINLDMLFVESIGLGGGLRVCFEEKIFGDVKVLIGFDSVGYVFIIEVFCFGGKIFMVIDIVVGLVDLFFSVVVFIGDLSLVNFFLVVI